MGTPSSAADVPDRIAALRGVAIDIQATATPLSSLEERVGSQDPDEIALEAALEVIRPIAKHLIPGDLPRFAFLQNPPRPALMLSRDGDLFVSDGLHPSEAISPSRALATYYSLDEILAALDDLMRRKSAKMEERSAYLKERDQRIKAIHAAAKPS